MNTAVIGSGRVGLVAGACLADFGLNVCCVDCDRSKIDALEAGELPFFEPGLKDLVHKNRAAGRLAFTTQLSDAVRKSLVLFIAVGTEEESTGKPNLKALEEVVASVGRMMNEYRVLVIKSTVPVGTAVRLAAKLREQTAVPFDIVSNPEFLREGSAIENFMRPDRVVLGASSDYALAILRDIYRPLYLLATPILSTDNTTAELIKYATNSFLALKITFINEMANLCDVANADVHAIANAVGLDKRIGPKFLHPGPGFGGSCLPKDSRTLLEIGKAFGCQMHMIQGMLMTNDGLCSYLLDKLKGPLEYLEGKTICVLGLSYKPDTDDVRESPAVGFVRALLREGAKVQAYDPMATAEATKALPEPAVTFHPSVIEAATGADAVAVLTEWNEFRNLDLEALRNAMNGNLLLDTRNIYDPEAMTAGGFLYVGRGRGSKPHLVVRTEEIPAAA